MPKYKPLEHYLRDLRAAGKPQIAITFSEIEKILGTPLPASARRYAAWWNNNEGSHVQAQAWLQPGYRTGDVDIPGQKLIFVAANQLRPQTPRGQVTNESPSIFGSMKGTTFVMQGVDLTEPTAPDWDGNS